MARLGAIVLPGYRAGCGERRIERVPAGTGESYPVRSARPEAALQSARR